MRNIRITLFAATAIPLLFFTGCEKDNRSKYIGDWEFVTEKILYQRDSIGYRVMEWGDTVTHYSEYVQIGCDTVYYSGKISVGNLEDELIIQFTENDEVFVHINKEREIWQTFPSFYSTCHRCSFGKFEKKDKLYLDKIHQFYENSVTEYYVTGAKKKGGKK